MMISEDSTVSYVVERDIDLIVAQLMQTSTEFQRWFAEQLDLDVSPDGLLGVRQSVFTDNGESDLEVGFETHDGYSHVVLIENKIDASMQDRQVERYVERGESYLDDGWDDFSVCLIAPAQYVGADERREFDAIVTYEAMMEVVETIDHDGSKFFGDLFEQSLEKRIPADHSDLTAAIGDRILSRAESLPDVEVYQRSNTQVRLESAHEDHPAPVLYNAYIPGPHDGDRAIVRINLTGRSSYSDEDVAALQDRFSEDLDPPPGFERKERPMDVVQTDVWREDFPTREAYIEHIVEELTTLIDHYHSRLLGTDSDAASSGPS